jgi:hypothetical protein
MPGVISNLDKILCRAGCEAMSRLRDRKATGRLGRRRHWEVGSDFHYMGPPPGPLQAWPHPAVWYALGRHALAALARHLSPRTRPVLWLPDYFCHDVASAWRQNCRIRFYRDGPAHAAPEWATLRPSPRDLVLAVNYFGVRQAAPWNTWRGAHPCILIEDHSHDPFSPWARSSRADYAFSSVRKTLPVPDGALLWSPRGRSLPPKPRPGPAAGHDRRLAAMILKTEYLSGRASATLKPHYRRLLRQGEELLELGPVAAAAPFTELYLAGGCPQSWRKRRTENARRLLKLLHGWRRAQPVFQKWPRGAAPLGVVLRFPSRAARNRCRAWLERHDVYCPIHWAAAPDSTPESKSMAACILTIPADQRYSAADMERIAGILGALPEK